MNEAIYTSIEKRLLSLKKHNIILDNMEVNAMKIAEIGYYRISQIIKRIHEQEPKRETELSQIIEIFYGEQELRSFLDQLISFWEISLRTLMSEAYSLWYGSFGYKDEQFFSDKRLHGVLMHKIEKQLDMKTLYEVIDDRKYEKIDNLPIWVAAEMSTFHMLTLMYELLPENKQRTISSRFGLEPTIFLSWIQYLSVVRNACAHQGLLFCRSFEREVILPKGMKQDVYAAIYILDQLLRDSKMLNSKEVVQERLHFPQLTGFERYYGFPQSK